MLTCRATKLKCERGVLKMNVTRTKRLTLIRALKILQLNFGTQVQQVIKKRNVYLADSICDTKRIFTRIDILNIEDELYSSFGC